MDFGIKGKRALVTGSSSPGGIGEGICKALLLEGVDVVVHGRKPDKAREVAEGLKPYGNVAVALGELSTDEGADSTAQMALEA
ncbi:MAG: family oxidoreductase, partial [Caulobacteraceae bacterium]|nr:family oxidoreductase [Caulobacteraceae bacterium]